MSLDQIEIRSYFDTRLSHEPMREKVWKTVTNYLLPYFDLHCEANVLELGCGYGHWIGSIPVQNRYALDINPDVHNRVKLLGPPRIKTYVSPCYQLEMFSDHTLDLVLASNLLEHLELEEIFQTLNEISRVLKDGGRFCVVQPNFALCPRQYFDDYTHRSVFTAVSLKDLLEAHGLQVTHSWNRFLPFSMKGKSARLTVLLPTYLRSPWKPFAGQMCMITRTKK